MKYFNWQTSHKKAFSKKTEKRKSPADQTLALEELHIRAWTHLKSICSRSELEKLFNLAQAYETGQRLHDTAF